MKNYTFKPSTIKVLESSNITPEQINHMILVFASKLQSRTGRTTFKADYMSATEYFKSAFNAAVVEPHNYEVDNNTLTYHVNIDFSWEPDVDESKERTFTFEIGVA